MYNSVDPKVSFPAMEGKVLEFWSSRGIFEKSVRQREGCEEFVFYDGPPFATGLPHFGNLLASTIKDVIPRYQTMKGKKVERRFGWDCHGLPVEHEMEKELGISGRKSIGEYGVARFNEDCRSIVLRYTREWRAIIGRVGRWVDFDHDYKTMDPDYMESIWWVMKELWNRGLLYRGFNIMPYSPKLATVLSNFEVNQGGYRDVQDPAITVRFRVKGRERTYILAWTTTPWTLPSNLALALGPEIDYVEIADGEDHYVLAKALVGQYYRSEADYKTLREFKGKEYAGVEYEPLFPYFAPLAATGAFRTFVGSHVSTEEGTGIVHTAPGFGEEDYALLKDTGIPVVCPIDDDCKFTAEVKDYEGVFVKDADKAIIRDLKARGSVVKHGTIVHAYPHCWRTDAPLIYRAVTSWFVAVEKIKPALLAANAQIRWMPAHLKDGRFGNWLAGARDWVVSRNRYWGNPIPIWVCEKCGQMICVGSRRELEERSGRSVPDLHKHFVDEILLPCGCGASMRRVPEVLDCWFESGAMPYGQSHYPFENREWFDAHFPADFIAEGLDQTRGWFYTLTVLAAALFDKPAFRNVVVNSLVLGADGKKLSKSRRNFTDPSVLMNQFGADALRLFLLSSPVVKAEDLRYTDDGVRDVVKNVLIPVWNAYSFYVTYANIDGVMPGDPPSTPANALDRWIISETERMVSEVGAQLDLYDLQKALEPISRFVDLLTNWYIRRSRRRFWRSESDADKLEAYQTLRWVLVRVATAACPFVPFLTEEIYGNLRREGDPESVHLCDYPVADAGRLDPGLERQMEVTRHAVSMGRALRTSYSLKTRQPLKALHVVTRDPEERRILSEMQGILREELNVKELLFRENEEELVEYRAKANFRVLGKFLGKDMKEAAATIEALRGADLERIVRGERVTLRVSGRTLELGLEQVTVERLEKENLKVLNEGSLTLGLDAELTEELVQEGLVRDLVRAVQSLRKDAGLAVTDRILVELAGGETMREAVERFEEHWTEEVLAATWRWKKASGATEIVCGGERCWVAIGKA